MRNEHNHPPMNQSKGLSVLAFFMLSFLSLPSTFAQHTVFLFGNLADAVNQPYFFKSLDSVFQKTETPFTLLVMGDLVFREVEKEGNDFQIQPTRDLADLVQKYPSGNLLIVPGDRDWNSSKRGGEKSLTNLEKRVRDYFKEKKYKRCNWAVRDGCPGPEVVEVDSTLAIIAINTQWWNHPYDKPRPTDAICEALLPESLKEALEDAMADYEDRNILLVGHHPFHSLGNYGGYFSVGDRFSPFPVVGSFRTAFRENVGRPRDISNERMKAFVETMNNLFYFHNNLIYASGHERNQQAVQWGNNFLLNSGAPTKAKYAAKDYRTVFSRKAPGVLRLDYFSSGRVDVHFLQLTKNQGFRNEDEATLFESLCEKGSLANSPKAPFENTALVPCEISGNNPANAQSPQMGGVTLAAGPEYEAGFFKKIFFGKHYRTTWTQPVKTSYLDLDDAKGGLTIFKKGGGRQTTSLKFKAADGTEYTFRSVNKDPAKALNYRLRPTLAASVIRDQTSTQNPYGAMAVASLLDNLDILHVSPKLYVLPDDPKLGQFQEKYAHLFGMLEENPGKTNKAGKYFGDADDILQSNEMFKQFYKDHNRKVVTAEYLRARLFDIWVGDWSKHEDNWKWAAYRGKDFRFFRPIPRDRDHVFSRQDGVFPWIADRKFGIPNIENFGYKIKDIQTLTFQAVHMDRFLLSEAPKSLFLEQAKYIQEHISQQDIEKAIRNMPSETYETSGKIVEAKLKKRLQDLTDYAQRYYDLLSEEVDVTGSNEEEWFDIERKEDGSVRVQIFNNKAGKKGSFAFYDRTFLPSETNEIRLWGLGSDDVFNVVGEGKNKIKISAFGGPGDDVFNDKAAAKTLFFDKGDKTEYNIEGGAKIAHHWDKEVYEYDRNRFNYNLFFPLPLISYNRFTGFGVGLHATWTIRKFGKETYAAKHSVIAGITSRGNKTLGYTLRLHHAIKKWDVEASAFYNDPDFFNFFYGLGNNAQNADELGRSFYQAKVNRVGASLGLVRDFWRTSSFSIKTGLERKENERQTMTFLAQNEATIFGAFQSFTLLPIETEFDLNFLDNKGLPYRGARAFTSLRHAEVLSGEGDGFGVWQGFIEHYLSNRAQRPLTLGLRFGGATAYGDVPWFGLPTLGAGNGLRGYFNNRFAGTNLLYFNSELRFQFVKKDKAFVPYKLGVKVFFDRGRVFHKNEMESPHWRNGYGFGFYFVPLTEALTASLSFGFSEEESVYPVFSIGAPLR